MGADIECVLALTSGEALAANTHFLRSLETTSAIVSTHFVTGQLDITGWTGKSRLTDARVVLTGCKIRARDRTTGYCKRYVDGLSVVTIKVSVGVLAGALHTRRGTLAFVDVSTCSKNGGLVFRWTGK